MGYQTRLPAAPLKRELRRARRLYGVTWDELGRPAPHLFPHPHPPSHGARHRRADRRPHRVPARNAPAAHLAAPVAAARAHAERRLVTKGEPMKITVPKKELAAAVKAVIPAFAKRATLPILAGVLLDASRSGLHIHRVLSEALGQAVRWQLLAVNPAIAVQPPRPTRPKLQIPEPELVESIVARAHGTNLYVPIVLAAATGMRRSEILGLRWKAVDLDKGLVRVVDTLQRSRHRGLEFAEPKTDRSRRTIVLPPFAVEVLRRHLLDQKQRRLRAGSAWHDADLMAEIGNGRPIDPGEFTRRFRRIAKDAGAPRVRLHDLRHAFATMLLASGVHPKIASEALGHSTVGITPDTYSHVLPNMQADAAAAIERALGSLGQRDRDPDDPRPPGSRVRRMRRERL